MSRRREKKEGSPQDVLHNGHAHVRCSSVLTDGARTSHLYVFLPLLACVSETPTSIGGSSQYGEAASSHACLLSWKPTVFVHTLKNVVGAYGGKQRKKKEKEKQRTALLGEMTGLSRGHQSCNDMSVKFSFLSPLNPFILPASLFCLSTTSTSYEQ